MRRILWVLASLRGGNPDIKMDWGIFVFMKKLLALVLAATMVLALVPMTAMAAAISTDAELASVLADLNDPVTGKDRGNVTIELAAGATFSDNYEIWQRSGTNITLKGNGATMGGQLEICGASNYGAETLTIENLVFDTVGATYPDGEDYALGQNKVPSGTPETNPRYPHNVTIRGCKFIGDGSFDAVAIKIRQGKNIVVENCEAEAVHSLYQGYGGEELSIKNSVVEDCKNGISLGTVSEASVEDCTISPAAGGYGVRMDANNSEIAIKNNVIEADDPIVIRQNSSVELDVTGNSFPNIKSENADKIFVFESGATDSNVSFSNNNSDVENNNVFMDSLVNNATPIPETGDGMGLFVFAGLALISVLGMAAMKKREEY